MKILQLSCHYFPNIGGVETHLSDLVSELIKKHHVFVLTYRPLTAKTDWRVFEQEKHLTIFRMPWWPGLFYKLVSKPAWEFLYLSLGLFCALPVVLIVNRPKVIHAHGIVAGFVGVVWGKIFNIKTVVSTHSIYHFPKSGYYRKLAQKIFTYADEVLCLSEQSVQEILDLGIDEKKVHKFTYWIDLNKFKPKPKLKNHQFAVLFVGRLVKEKGILVLDQVAKKLPNILFKVAGVGPEKDNLKHMQLLGAVSQDELPDLYNSANLVIIPSIHEEGFGRVAIEAIACATPVLAANRGALPEAINSSVGVLIDITTENLVKQIRKLKSNPLFLQKLGKNCRPYANRRFSVKNLKLITDYYI